jgi:hypothetical protein
MREIVSRQFPHSGGFAHVEMDAGGHLFLVCSGCRSEAFEANMAGALLHLAEHVGPDAVPLPD